MVTSGRILAPAVPLLIALGLFFGAVNQAAAQSLPPVSVPEVTSPLPIASGPAPISTGAGPAASIRSAGAPASVVSAGAAPPSIVSAPAAPISAPSHARVAQSAGAVTPPAPAASAPQPVIQPGPMAPQGSTVPRSAARPTGPAPVQIGTWPLLEGVMAPGNPMSHRLPSMAAPILPQALNDTGSPAIADAAAPGLVPTTAQAAETGSVSLLSDLSASSLPTTGAVFETLPQAPTGPGTAGLVESPVQDVASLASPVGSAVPSAPIAPASVLDTAEGAQPTLASGLAPLREAETIVAPGLPTDAAVVVAPADLAPESTGPAAGALDSATSAPNIAGAPLSSGADLGPNLAALSGAAATEPSESPVAGGPPDAGGQQPSLADSTPSNPGQASLPEGFTPDREQVRGLQVRGERAMGLAAGAMRASPDNLRFQGDRPTMDGPVPRDSSAEQLTTGPPDAAAPHAFALYLLNLFFPGPAGSTAIGQTTPGPGSSAVGLLALWCGILLAAYRAIQSSSLRIPPGITLSIPTPPG